MARTLTDVIFQGIKVYIEGVQVPFESISITQGIGMLPVASLTVPPQAGLMDIARFYQPKVHIFYEDRIGQYGTSPDDQRKKMKVLFNGHISAVSYSKSTQGSGSVGINFQCTHKNNLLNECLIDYTGWLKEDTDQFNGAAVKSSHHNSAASVLESLSGIGGKVDATLEISEANPDGRPDILPYIWKDLYPKVQGMTGILINYWSQLKRVGFNKKSKQYHEGFTKLYLPLVEDGIRFFQRISGHPYLESIIEADSQRVEPCPDTPGKYRKILIPPCNKLFLQSAVQADLTVKLVNNYLQTSGEITNMFQIFNSFFESMDYEMVTLTSPGDVPLATGLPRTSADDMAGPAPTTSIVETLIKPRIPFYYSPLCNVYFPKMYSTLEVTYDEANIPTRVDIQNLESPSDDKFPNHFRAPHSVRTAIASKTTSYDATKLRNLAATVGTSAGAIGLYEQGRGVKLEAMIMPRWLSFLSSTAYGDGSNAAGAESMPDREKDPEKYQALEDLKEGWMLRFPNEFDKDMCPWAAESGILSHHKILFAAADYYYTQAVARSKMGSISGPFNPYVVPGYPMDILEASPQLPSFHAMCTSVTHSITAASIGTSVQFSAAMTYAEMANYYFPFAHPFLQVALNLAKNQTIIQNPEAKQAADEFYLYALGVPAVAPDDIHDFNTGLVKPIAVEDGRVVEGSPASIPGPNQYGELNPNLTFEGNLHLIARPIENQYQIQTDFEVKFIDMTIENYSSTVIKYEDGVLQDSAKLELGQSQFLEYKTYLGVTEDDYSNQPAYEDGSSVVDMSDSSSNDDGYIDGSTVV